MLPGHIVGCTRIMTKPVGTTDEQCISLEIQDVPDELWGNLMVSAWVPSDAEREAIANGAPVLLSIVGTTHPVVSLSTGIMVQVGNG